MCLSLSGQERMHIAGGARRPAGMRADRKDQRPLCQRARRQVEQHGQMLGGNRAARERINRNDQPVRRRVLVREVNDGEPALAAKLGERCVLDQAAARSVGLRFGIKRHLHRDIGGLNSLGDRRFAEHLRDELRIGVLLGRVIKPDQEWSVCANGRFARRSIVVLPRGGSIRRRRQGHTSGGRNAHKMRDEYGVSHKSGRLQNIGSLFSGPRATTWWDGKIRMTFLIASSGWIAAIVRLAKFSYSAEDRPFLANPSASPRSFRWEGATLKECVVVGCGFSKSGAIAMLRRITSGLLVLVALVSIQAARAESPTASAEVRVSLDAMHAYVRNDANGQRWKRFLMSDQLTAELAKGNVADREVLKAVLRKYSGAEYGLHRPEFVAVKKALTAWIAELEQPAPAEAATAQSAT